MNTFHTSVLLKEIIDFLDVREGKKYIDATLGGGGHTVEILKRGGIVLGIDVDEEAIKYVEFRIQSSEFRVGRELFLVRGNFRNIDEIARSKGFDRVWGIIFDLGVSSYQLDTVRRGFSFQKDAALDMRMDEDLKIKASDLVNILTKGELYELFTKLGQERNAHAISNNIIRARRIKPIEKTSELVEIIRKSSRKDFFPINPATRVFQALRIAVNDELNNLKEALPKAIELLEKNGILAVISFHSLEDRIVKNEFTRLQNENRGINLTKKPIMPNMEEIKINKRSRSAKLRIFKKL